jgi:hypothetical protein
MDIRGSVRNHVYGAWNGRHYVRSNAEKVGNPKTLKQNSGIRAPIAQLTKDWQDTLSDIQRAGWESFAKEQGSKVQGDKHKGGTGIIPENHLLMSGYNAFVMCNMLLRSVDPSPSLYPEILNAPAGINPPTPPEITSLDFEEALGADPRRLIVGIRTPFNWGPPRIGCSEYGRIRVWLKPTTYYPRIQVTQDGEPDSPSEVEVSEYRERNENQGIIPGRYSVALDAVNAYGLRSASSALLYVMVPQPIMPAPELLSILPVSGTAAGGTDVVITGTGFRIGATVTFDAVPATDVVIVSSTEIAAKTPAHAVGAVDVKVINTDAQEDTLAAGFEYV